MNSTQLPTSPFFCTLFLLLTIKNDGKRVKVVGTELTTLPHSS